MNMEKGGGFFKKLRTIGAAALTTGAAVTATENVGAQVINDPSRHEHKMSQKLHFAYQEIENAKHDSSGITDPVAAFDFENDCLARFTRYFDMTSREGGNETAGAQFTQADYVVFYHLFNDQLMPIFRDVEKRSGLPYPNEMQPFIDQAQKYLAKKSGMGNTMHLESMPPVGKTEESTKKEALHDKRVEGEADAF